MPKVSVIIPVYQVERFIENCARSLFEQTLDDIEYLFIDDCSTDRSVDILQQVINEYPNRKQQVAIHRMEQNSGQALVRKWGMKHAVGDFLIHCDTDDWPEKDQYEIMYNTAIDQSADLIFCDYYRVYPNGKKVYNDRNINIDNKIDLLHRMLTGYHDVNQLWDCMMRRNLIQDIEYPEGNQGEDRVIMFQVIYNSTKMTYVKEALYNYFINSNSLVRSTTPDKLIERAWHSAKNLETILKCLKKYGLHDTFTEQIVFSKFEPRIILSLGLYNKKCREHWYNIYPEINKSVFKNRYITKSSKLKELIMRMHLGSIYGYLYYIIKHV